MTARGLQFTIHNSQFAIHHSTFTITIKHVLSVLGIRYYVVFHFIWEFANLSLQTFWNYTNELFPYFLLGMEIQRKKESLQSKVYTKSPSHSLFFSTSSTTQKQTHIHCKKIYMLYVTYYILLHILYICDHLCLYIIYYTLYTDAEHMMPNVYKVYTYTDGTRNKNGDWRMENEGIHSTLNTNRNRYEHILCNLV